MPKQFHVQVLETPADGDFFPARELLPWADPYIASLMGRLAGEADDEGWDFRAKDDVEFGSEELLNDELPEDWHLDRESPFPPVYGGWPLLNDLPASTLQD